MRFSMSSRRSRPAQSWPDVFVLELSSFQLETTHSLAPAAAAVLNVTDNHLDRYAGMDDYAAAKARIFAGGGVQVVNRDDPRSLAMRIDGRIDRKLRRQRAPRPKASGDSSNSTARRGWRAAANCCCTRTR